MEGELSPQRMQREQINERIAHYQEQGLDAQEAATLAGLMHAQQYGVLGESEKMERARLLAKLAGKEEQVIEE